MTVADFVRSVRTVDLCVALSEAAHEMRKCKVKALVVVDGEIPVGVVTEQQVVDQLAAGLPQADATVDDVMSRQAFRLRPTDDAAKAVERMRALGIVLAPVVDCRGHLRGLFSVDNYHPHFSEELPGQTTCAQQEEQTSSL